MEGEHFIDIVKFVLIMLVFENPVICVLLVAWITLYTLFGLLPDEIEAWRKDRLARREMELRVKEYVRLCKLERDNERKNNTPR